MDDETLTRALAMRQEGRSVRQTAMALKVPRATLARTLAASQKVGTPKGLVEPPRRSRAGAGGGSVMHFRDATRRCEHGGIQGEPNLDAGSNGVTPHPTPRPGPCISRWQGAPSSQKSVRRPVTSGQCSGCSVISANPNVTTLHADREGGVLRVGRVLGLGDGGGWAWRWWREWRRKQRRSKSTG